MEKHEPEILLKFFFFLHPIDYSTEFICKFYNTIIQIVFITEKKPSQMQSKQATSDQYSSNG